MKRLFPIISLSWVLDGEKWKSKLEDKKNYKSFIDEIYDWV